MEASLPAEQPVASNKSTNIPARTSPRPILSPSLSLLWGPGTLRGHYTQEFAFVRRRGVRPPARQRRASSGLGAPARAQPVQLASLEVVIQSSSSTGLPQYVSFIWGLATWTLPIPLAWRMFTADSRRSAPPGGWFGRA